MNMDFTLSYCAVSLIALGLIYYSFFVRMRSDAYRATIRRIRDDLFDYMWRNGYTFDTPAYRKARETLNALLRVSNRLSLPVVVLTTATMKAEALSRPTPAPALDLPPGPLAERISLAYRDAMKATVDYVFFTGLKGWLMRGLFLLIGAARTTGRWQPFAQEAVKETIHHSGPLALSVGPRCDRLAKVN